MAHARLSQREMRAAVSLGALVAAVVATACGGAPAAPGLSAAPVAAAPSAPRYPADDASWGRFNSKRLLLSFPLPDGKAWRIDDHSRPSLFAVHDATGSKLTIATTQEDDLMNRKKCEERARGMGWVESTTLTTVDDEVTIGPEAYDSRVWVALDAGKPGGAVEGHVYLFGAFVRRCLLVHLSTRVPSAKNDDVLSERLALARARIFRGIAMTPPRVTDDAVVPRDKPEIRR